jgi:hypothetical protein
MAMLTIPGYLSANTDLEIEAPRRYPMTFVHSLCCGFASHALDYRMPRTAASWQAFQCALVPHLGGLETLASPMAVPTIEDKRSRKPEPRHLLMLPQIDRLIALLFKHSDYNPDALSRLQNEHAAKYHALQNAMPLNVRR